MNETIKRRLTPPIDRLRTRAQLSALKAAVLRDKLKAAEAAARQDRVARRKGRDAGALFRGREGGAMNDLLAPGGEFAGRSITVLLNQGAMVGEPKAGSKRFWTTGELKVIREHYPTGGLAACLPLLPGRAAPSIYQKAFELGVGSLVGGQKPRAKRQVYVATPELDQSIRDAYASDDPLKALKNLTRLTGRPRAWFINRAAALGLSRPKLKEAPWSEAELALLEARSHLAPGTIRGELRAAGFKRTANAVALKLRQRGWRREKAEGRYNKATLQACFGVSGATLSRWADRCGLKVERERPMLAPRGAEPHAGAEWSVRERHLRAFVIDNVAIIDFRKVDKFWLVDLLAGKSEAKGHGE